MRPNLHFNREEKKIDWIEIKQVNRKMDEK